METASYFDWQAAYGHMHDRFPATRKRPVVGITGNFGDKGCELAEGYYASVLAAGAVPVVIPPFEDRDALAATLETVDGLLLSGGGDLATWPNFYSRAWPMTGRFPSWAFAAASRCWPPL